MRILVINGSDGEGILALIERGDDGGLTVVRQAGQSGQAMGERRAERMAGVLDDLLLVQGWEIGSLGLIAAVTGPGSFTGLRATLALAQGIALGTGAALQGVAANAALRRCAGDGPDLAPLWCVGMARRDRVFLERDAAQGPEAFMMDVLPLPDRPIRLAGDASLAVAARIGSAGGVAVPSGVERPDVWTIAAVALDQHEGRLPSRVALPLYVDPPEAKRPAAGLRPSPL